MKNNWILICLMILAATCHTQCFTSSKKEYLFGLMEYFPVLNIFNIFDRPYRISNALAGPSNTKQATYEQIEQALAFSSATYCFGELENLSAACGPCDNFRGDVTTHKLLRNDTYNTFALVALLERRKQIVIAFRGSSNLWNFVLDFDYVKIKANGKYGKKAMVHRGFHKAVMSLFNHVIDTVEHLRCLKKEYKKYSIVITGHSLGGAMARVCRYKFLQLHLFPGVKFIVITFGEPRSGNKVYVDRLNALHDITARVVARADIVPHLPPTKVLQKGSYLHCNNEFFVNGKKDMRYCGNKRYESRKCSNSIGPFYSILDHLNYLDELLGICIAQNPIGLLSLPGLDLTNIKLPKPISIVTKEMFDFIMKKFSPDSEDLECEVTKKFKDDVEKHWVLRNAIENTLALVSLSERRKEIVVAYRGTSNASNFILDLFAIKGDERISGIKGIKMHRGFYIATMSLYEDVISAVRHLRSLKPAYKDYKLVICGHSLGGAMARITQYFLHFLNPFADVKLEVYTYGEPRSGNKDFVDYLNGKTDVTARVCSSVCNAPTDPAKTKLPTLEDMMYFNYYAASMYSSFDLKNLTCEYCEKFKNDVIKHTMLRNDTHNTLALVTLSEIRKEIVVAFRGSSNIWNVLLDLFMIMGGEGISEIEGIKLHRGFYIATMSLYDAVTSAVGHLQSLKPDYAKYVIVLCGHSLGGAMSRMTQYFWHVLNQFPGAKFKVITYGEPRSGNKHYVDYLNGKTDITARVSARSDVVCHFPTTKVLGNDDPYMHVQTEYFIDGKDNQ
ncbi:Lipase, partial [Pseudolycoriella hygida]